jgi:Arc/MetJ-type ribon-helix-helix transcriptional regulator
MSKQLTIRLADDLVDFIDRKVESGQASSRAAVIAGAVERARRQEIVERDVAILANAHAADDDLAGLAAFAARIPLGDLA